MITAETQRPQRNITRGQSDETVRPEPDDQVPFSQAENGTENGTTKNPMD